MLRRITVLLLFTLLGCEVSFSQEALLNDSLIKGTTISNVYMLDSQVRQIAKEVMLAKKHTRLPLFGSVSNSFHRMPGRMRIKVTDGIVGYGMNYRGILDTPVVFNGLVQHQANIQFNLQVAERFPLMVNGLMRKSNSSLFRDILDIQVGFDVVAFRKQEMDRLSMPWKDRFTSLNDSFLLQKLKSDIKKLNQSAQIRMSEFSVQQLVEANEVLVNPSLLIDPSAPDSVKLVKADSLKALALAYLDSHKNMELSIKAVADSIKSVEAYYVKYLEEKQALLKIAGTRVSSFEDLRNLMSSSELKAVSKSVKMKNDSVLNEFVMKGLETIKTQKLRLQHLKDQLMVARSIHADSLTRGLQPGSLQLNGLSNLVLDSSNQKNYEYDSRIGDMSKMLSELAASERDLQSIKSRVDSIEQKFQSTEQLASAVTTKVKSTRREIGVGRSWVSHIQKFSIGRIQPTGTDLIIRNQSLKGITFEYNSWYFLSATAGLIDYRFRDFNFKNERLPRQHFYLVRVGIGKVNANNVIVSAFRGRKNAFISGVTGRQNTSFLTSGISLTGQVVFPKVLRLQGEIAESVSPNFSVNPAKTNRLNFKSTEDKAIFLKLVSEPNRRFSFEAHYRYQGAQFQSFNQYQPNARQNSWMVKGAKSFFKSKLRLSGFIRQNNFENNQLVVDYSARTIQKSIQVSWKKKKWPSINIGYFPVTQVSKLGESFYQTQVQTISSVVFYQFKRKNVVYLSTISANKYFSPKNMDSIFRYGNAVNIYATQQMVRPEGTFALEFMHTSNGASSVTTYGENIHYNLSKCLRLRHGAKMYDFQGSLLMGFLSGVELTIPGAVTLFANYEKGYINGVKEKYLSNNTGSIQVIKRM